LQLPDFLLLRLLGRLDLRQAPLHLEEFALDLDGPCSGGVPCGDRGGNPLFLAPRGGTVVRKKRPEQDGGVSDQDHVGKDGVVGQVDRHLGGRRQKARRCRAARRSREDGAPPDVERGKTIRRHHEDAYPHAAPADPGRLRDDSVDSLLELRREGFAKRVHTHGLGDRPLEVPEQKALGHPHAGHGEEQEGKDREVDQAEVREAGPGTKRREQRKRLSFLRKKDGH
jgi:hypothetical protein